MQTNDSWAITAEDKPRLIPQLSQEKYRGEGDQQPGFSDCGDCEEGWWNGDRWWLNRRSLWYVYLFITTTLNTMSPLSNCSLSSSLSCLWTILTVPASPEVLSLSRCWTARSSSRKHVKPSVVWRMNDAICVSMVVDVNGWSLWCRKRICRYRLWRIAAATFRGVLFIGITQLQRSTPLCISYMLLYYEKCGSFGLFG